MGFVATVRTHVRNMTLNFGKTCMPWGQRRSVLAGCSGAFFVLPGVFALREEDARTRRVLLAFAAQAVLSVMSDYVSTGRDSVWHGLDRWMSSGMTVRATRRERATAGRMTREPDSVSTPPPRDDPRSSAVRPPPDPICPAPPDAAPPALRQLFMIRFAHDALSPAHVALAAPPLACLYRSKRAIATGDWTGYVRWHAAWHVCAVAAATYVMYLENGTAGIDAARAWVGRSVFAGRAEL